ncbi:MAG: MFS transporter, partial [Serpentinimonas sp.]|nr:MFS transporter [Serpentinimonas sp.]
MSPPPIAPEFAPDLGPVLRPGVRRREALGWAMFDFANSGYTTVVITAIYGDYFVSVVAGGTTWATLAWTAALAFSNLLVLLSAPVLGAWADVHAGKKRLAALTTVGCVLTTAALGWIGPGSVVLALGLLVLSNAFFSSGGNLVAAFLPELARPQRLGTLSGWGWGLGYIGGLLCLALCLAYIHWAQARGHTASEFVPVTLLITAGLFAITALPFFIWVRERAQPQPRSGVSAWAQVAKTWRESARFQDMRRFLICIVFYQAGIMTVIALAAIYAQEVMGFDTAQTVMMIFVVNITAAIGALGFGYLQD